MLKSTGPQYNGTDTQHLSVECVECVRHTYVCMAFGVSIHYGYYYLRYYSSLTLRHHVRTQFIFCVCVPFPSICRYGLSDFAGDTVVSSSTWLLLLLQCIAPSSLYFCARPAQFIVARIIMLSFYQCGSASARALCCVLCPCSECTFSGNMPCISKYPVVRKPYR